VTGECKRLRNEKLYDLYSSPNIFQLTKARRKRLVGYVARICDRRCAYKILVRKPEVRVKRPLGKLRLQWYYNIKMNLQDVGWRGVDWIYLAQDRNKWRALVNVVMKLWVP
jgi:hypothetical protein